MKKGRQRRSHIVLFYSKNNIQNREICIGRKLNGCQEWGEEGMGQDYSLDMRFLFKVETVFSNYTMFIVIIIQCELCTVKPHILCYVLGDFIKFIDSSFLLIFL